MPQLLFSLLGGVAADRFDKRKILLIAHTALAVVAAINAVLVHTRTIEVWHLVVLGILQGVIFPFNIPTRQAYIPELVPRRQLSNAVAASGSAQNLNRVLAPSIAGLLLAWDPAFAFYAVAAFNCLAAVLLWRLPPSKPAQSRQSTVLADLAGGFRYILGHPTLRVLLGMAYVPVLLGLPFQLLLPVFQKDVLRVGEAQLGLLYASAGVGALLGTIVIARLSDYAHKGRVQIVSGVCFGLSLIAFALASKFELALVFLFFVGLSSQAYLTVNSVLMINHCDRKLYGRVIGIYLMTWSLMPVVMFPIGGLVDMVGAPATLAGSGLLLAIFIVLIAIRYPAHWNPGGGGTDGRTAPKQIT